MHQSLHDVLAAHDENIECTCAVCMTLRKIKLQHLTVTISWLAHSQCVVHFCVGLPVGSFG